DVRIVFQHPLFARKDVFVLQSTVIDQLPEILSVTTAATVFGRQHRITLSQQLAKTVDIARVEIAMNAAVDEDQKGQLGSRRLLFGDERIGRDNDRIAGALRRGILDDSRCRCRVAYAVNVRKVLQPVEEHLLIDSLGQVIMCKTTGVLHSLQAFEHWIARRYRWSGLRRSD